MKLVIIVILLIILICLSYQSTEAYNIACTLSYVPENFYPALSQSVWKIPMKQSQVDRWMTGFEYAYVYEIDFDKNGYMAVLYKSGNKIGNFTMVSDSEGCQDILTQSPITGTMTFQQTSPPVFGVTQNVGEPYNVSFVLQRNAYILDPVTNTESNTILQLTLPFISPTPLTFIATALPTCQKLNLPDGC